MKRAYLIGLNYKGSPYALPDCDLDAKEMEKRMAASLYKTNTFVETFSARDFLGLCFELNEIGHKSDITAITYSGHGTQWDGGTESDRMEEGLCFWNGKTIEVMPDDDFRLALEQIPGIVYVFLDSCFSGGMERDIALPQKDGWTAIPMFPKRKRFIPFQPEFEIVRYERSLSRTAKATGNKIYFLMACQESEVSWSTGTGGLFTKSFCKVYDETHPKQRFISKLMPATESLCIPDQRPKYEIFGGNASKRIF